MASAEFLDLVRLPAAQRQRLLASMDDRAGGNAPKRCRKSARHATRGEMTPMIVLQPGGNVSAFLVMMRNLSAGGLAVIHGGFIHPGTQCRVLLATVSGKKVVLVGAVRRCRHVRGVLHEIGLEFEAAIAPEDFVPAELLSAHVDELLAPADAESEDGAEASPAPAIPQEPDSQATEPLVQETHAKAA